MTLWGGRFAVASSQPMRALSDSFAFDRRLYAADIEGSIAYAGALERAGLLTTVERDALIDGLQRVKAEFKADTFQGNAGDEDIHSAVERRLSELIGSVAGKLHTGRSRNDQVSTDLRLYLLQVIDELCKQWLALQSIIVRQATCHIDVLMPGYTHLQPAQPVRFSHWLMSFFWKLQRDRDRLNDIRRHTASLPLGAGALAGNPFEIDRQWLAQELHFLSVAANSMDAVSDRDYVVEFLAWAALAQVHLSSLVEDLVLWSTREYGFVCLNEAYTTGSSLMPQKRNPDPLELVRGKSGRMIGHLTGILTLLKGLPSGYNKDLQEDKESLFDAVDTLFLELPVLTGAIDSLQINGERMTAALDEALLATDLADYLVRKGVPFRESHHLVGQVVKRAESLGVPMSKLSLHEYQDIHVAFAEDLYDVFDYERSVERRQVQGGTARASVLEQIALAHDLLSF